MDCQHLYIKNSIKIHKHENDPRFVAQISFACNECNLPFQFLDLPSDNLALDNMYQPSAPGVGITALLPIIPMQITESQVSDLLKMESSLTFEVEEKV